MAKGIRENEKFPPSSIAVFLEHLPAKTAADHRFEEGRERSSELMQTMQAAKLTRCELIYLKHVCRYGNREIESFCRGRKYNPSLQVPTTRTGPYSQTHAVFMQISNGDLYRRAIELMRRADRYVYDGRRIDESNGLPPKWKATDDKYTDMVEAREALAEILNSEIYVEALPQQKQEDVA